MDGKEVEVFKEKIVVLDFIDNIENKVDSLKENVVRNIMKIFNYYGDVIISCDEVKCLVN